MATVKYLADIDLNKNALNNAVIQPLSTAPGSPADGQIYFDTDTADINVYNGSAWVRLGPTGAGDIESVVAGAGMTGGGTSGDATLNVIGGTGITANANDIAIDSTVATLSGSQTLTNKTIAASQVTEISNLTAGEGAQLENIGSTTISATQWGYLGAASGAITNTDTQLSTEAVQDIVGAMTTGNTESGITVAYQDADGTLDFTVGTLNQNTTGSAATLTTARAINGVDFNGSAAITVTAAAGTLSGNTLKSTVVTSSLTSVGTIGTGVWNGSVIADAYLSTNTAHLDTTQTFTGAKTFTNTLALTGTGRITGIDTVSAATDAASKTYVDAHVWDGDDITSGTVVSARLDADTAHLTTAQTFTGSKTMGTNVKLNFRDANAYINSPTANDIEVVGTTITLDAGSDIQLEGDTTVTGDFSITGTLNVDGTTTTIDSTTVAIADSMLKLAKDQANTADAVDFGFYGQYGVSGTHKYAGIFRDLSVSGDPFTFFDSLQAEPGATVNTSGTGYDLADISAGTITAADGFAGDLTGTAAEATILANARTIGGVSFNGSANISLPGVNTDGNQDTSGSAATLTTARTIGGVSFNGSANINLPGVNTAGNQATSGLAGTATKLATERAINGVGFDGTAAITVTAAAGTLSGNTLKSTVVTSSLTSVGTIGTGVWNGDEITAEYTAAKVSSIVAGAGIDVNNSGVGDVTVTAETASATNPGIVELATTAEALAGSDTTRAVTAAGLAARSYRAAIGDGSATAIAVTHSLGTRDVNVQMYDASSYETVMAQVVRNTTAQVTVTFNTAPTSGDVIILISKID